MWRLPRSVWDEPRAPDAPRGRRRDRVLVAVCMTLVVLEALARSELPHRLLWVALALAVMPTLYWRRSLPLAMVSIAFLGSAVVTLLTGGEQSGLNSLAAILLLPYALVRWGSGREVVLGVLIVVFGAVTAMVASDLSPADAAGGLIVLSSVMVLGLALRYRARAKTRELEQVKLLERERLARDLHDTVAHHVSAMAIRAQAGIVTAAAKPDAALDALRVIEVEATRTLAEMRAMVGVLRGGRLSGDDLGAVETSPTPGFGDLRGLARTGGHGPAVEIEVSGEVADLPASVGTAIYRVAQESVTNAVRHARNATRVDVRVTVDDSAVQLFVDDDGDAGPGPARAGYGLVGMIERVELLGGSCAVGPGPGRGWRVRAVLPRAARGAVR